MNDLINFNEQKLIEGWLEQERQGVEFPVDFDLGWGMAGYARKSDAKRKLVAKSTGLKEGIHYFCGKCRKNPTRGRPSDKLLLTNDAFKHFCLSAGTEKGFAIRQYYIEIEKSWKLVQQHHPAIAQEIEILKLQEQISANEALKAKYEKESKEIDQAMLTIHGTEITLALRGHADQIVETEKPTIEVIDERHNLRYAGQTLKQIATYLNKTHGYKIKSGGEIERILEEAGEQGLIGSIPRTVPAKYVPEENLEEAIATIKSILEPRRQLLLGE